MLVVVVALSAMAAACSTSRGNPGPRSAVDARCADSIDAYCALMTCVSFDEAAEHARRPQSKGTMKRFEIGTCGAYRCVHVREDMVDRTELYDASGKLVSFTRASDAPICSDHRLSTQIGSKPSCEMKVLESSDESKPD